MMEYQTLDARTRALELAVSRGEGVSTNKVVEEAKQFADFLINKGEKSRGSVDG